METIKNVPCPNCEVISPGHSIRLTSFENPKCVVCGKQWSWPVPPSPVSTPRNDTQLAKDYLKETGLHLTPDAVRDALWTGAGHITHGALSRKFRAASTGDNPQLKREHYTNAKGRTITRYFWNPEYKEKI